MKASEGKRMENRMEKVSFEAFLEDIKPRS